jgi:hypothetical protein
MLIGSIVALFDGESLGRLLNFYDFYYIFGKSSAALNGKFVSKLRHFQRNRS